MFDKDELNRLRQWFTALQDTAPQYVEEADRELQKKIEAALAVGPELDATSKMHIAVGDKIFGDGEY